MSANNSSLIITKVSQSKAYPLITLYAKTYSLSFFKQYSTTVMKYM